MKKAVFTVVVGLVLAFASNAPVIGAASKARAIAHLVARDCRPVGTASFIATSHGVLFELDLKSLLSSPHAIHLHTSGNCDPKVAFISAGPDLSFEPTKLHGFLAPHGPHPGDLPNEYAAADGTLHASMISNAISLGNGKKSIFDRDGASIIVHAKGDDYVGQPAGNSGDRNARGVIERTVAPGSRRGGKRKAHK
jgi:Cu-Zn family superoxide dismutase